MASTDTTAPDASTAALIPLGSQAKAGAIELKRPITLLGSRKDAVRVHLQSSTVSKAHAAVVLNAWGCYVHDLGSRTGTLVNGKPVIDQDLADGDVIQIGRFQFKYRAPQRTRPKPLPLPAADISLSHLPVTLSANRRVIVIGRRAGSDVEFAADSRVSNVHAIVVEQDGRRLVRDLNSRTGTWLDDKPVHQEPLPDFEALRIGGSTVTFKPRGTLAGAVHPESALPIPLDEAGPAAGAVIGLDAADGLGLLSPAPPAGVPADDDLAALRRDWKAPPLPPQPVPPPAPAPAAEARVRPPEPTLRPPAAPPTVAPVVVPPTPVVERPAPVEPEPIEPEPLELESLEFDPAAPAAEVPLVVPSPAPVTETPFAPVVVPPVSVEPTALELEPFEPDPAAPAAGVASVVPSPTPTAGLPAVTVPPEEAGPDLDPLAEPLTVESERGLADDAVVEAEPVDLRPEPVTDRQPFAAERLELDLLAERPLDTTAGRTLDASAGRPADEAATEPSVDQDAFTDAAVDDAPAVLSAEAGTRLADPPAEADDTVLPDELPATDADLAPDAAALAPATHAAVPPSVVEADAELLTLDDADVTSPLAEAPGVETERRSDAPAEHGLPEPEVVDAEAEAEFVPPASAAAVVDADAARVALDDGLITAPLADAGQPARPSDVDAAIPAGLALTPEADDAVAVADPATADADDAVAMAGIAVADADESVAVADTALSDADLTMVSDDAVDAAADLDRPTPDPVAPAVAPADAATADAPPRPPFGLDTPAVVVADAGPTEDADRPLTHDDLDLGSLDLADVEFELDADALHAGTTAGPDAAAADVNAVVLDADAAAVDANALVPDPAAPAPGAAAETLAGVDLVDLALDLDEDADAEEPAGLAGPAVVNSVVLQPPTAEVAANLSDSAGVISPDELTPAVTSVSSAFEPPAAPAVVEPDRVRLGEDDDADDENEATALAVDLGLVFEDDAHLPPPAPVAGPAGSVDIDLAAAPPVPPAVAETHPAEDVFDADEIDAFLADLDREQYAKPPIDAPSFETPPATAEAEAPAADDEATPPKGGSLSDLIPSGPPLVGGSFMSLPPMLAPMPPAPPPPGQPGGPKRRPMRVGFGGEGGPRSAAPFAAGRTIADAAGKPSDDADDDFAHVPSDSPAGPFGGGATIAATPLRADPVEARAPAANRPRGVIAPILPGVRPAEEIDAPATLPRVVQAYAPPLSPEAEAERVRLHKKRVRRVVACLAGGVVLIGGAAWGVYYFTPLKSTVDALISYDRLDNLGLAEANEFRVGQNALLMQESTRTAAIGNLPPAVTAGFLGDGRALLAAVSDDAKIRWPAEQPTRMRLRVRTVDKQNDVARVRALAEQMVAAGEGDRKQIKLIKDKLRDDEDQMRDRKAQIKSLDDQIQALSQATLGRGTVKDASALNAEYLAAEPALTAIKSRRQELEATVDRLSKPFVGPANGTGLAGDPTVADAEIEKRSKELNDLTQAGTRPALDAGAEARKKLDEVISSFEGDLARAQGLGGGTPQLNAYIDTAKRSFVQMREMTSGLIRRQETNLARIADLKTKLSDNMLAKAEARVAKDTELKKLRDSQAMLERQRNAAVGSNQSAEVIEKANLDLRILNIKLAEREVSLRADAMDNEAIAALEKYIKDGEAELAKDRRSVDESLTTVQNDFLRAAPGIEKMPAEQAALAQGIGQKFAAMTEARKAYAQATERAQADAARAEAQNRNRANELRTEIAALRDQTRLAAETKQAEANETERRAQLAAAQTELTDVRESERRAQHRVTDATAAMDAANKARQANAQAEADRQTKTAARDAAEREYRTLQNAYSVHTGQFGGLIVPGQVELTTYDDPDRRPVTLAALVAGLVALLLIPLSIDLLGLYRASHEPEYADEVDGEGFEPVLADNAETRKALPEPASV